MSCELPILFLGVKSNAPPLGVVAGEHLSIVPKELSGVDRSSADISEVILLLSEEGENERI